MATWTISTIEHNVADGGVIVAHWRVTESETVGAGDDAVTYTASSYGTCGFTPDPTADDFVAYDSLTEATVLGWVWDNMDKDATEEALTADIARQKEPVTTYGTPWA
jgi:hypothetical protein